MRFALILTSLAFLSACGADAPPERPQGGQADGLVFSGDARLGLAYNSAPGISD